MQGISQQIIAIVLSCLIRQDRPSTHISDIRKIHYCYLWIVVQSAAWNCRTMVSKAGSMYQISIKLILNNLLWLLYSRKYLDCLTQFFITVLIIVYLDQINLHLCHQKLSSSMLNTKQSWLLKNKKCIRRKRGSLNNPGHCYLFWEQIAVTRTLCRKY